MTKIKSITIADNEEYLRQISIPVDLNDKTLKHDITILEEYCLNNNVLAMAAVQLGIPKRLIYLKNTNLDIVNKIQTDSIAKEEQHYNEARILINPVIISKEGLTTYWEACASCLNNFGHVKRPYKIVVEYYDINNQKHLDTFEGFESTVLAHEMDHLDGILHIDKSIELYDMPVEERKEFRKTHTMEIIKKDGEFKQTTNNFKKIEDIK